MLLQEHVIRPQFWSVCGLLLKLHTLHEMPVMTPPTTADGLLNTRMVSRSSPSFRRCFFILP